MSALAGDAGYVGGEIVAAAFAAGAAVANQPALLADSLSALVKGDFKGALQRAVQAIAAPLAPTMMVVDALVNVIERGIAQLPVVAPVPSGTPAATLLAAPDRSSTMTAKTDTVQTTDAATTTAPVRVSRRPAAPPQTAPAPGVVPVPQPAAAVGSALAEILPALSPEAASVDQAAAAPSVVEPVRVAPSRKAAHSAVKSVADQAGRAADAVARGAAEAAEAVGKIAERARGGQAAAGSRTN